MNRLAPFKRPWRALLSPIRFWRFSRRWRREVLARERVDLLLARVSREGLGALAPAERRFLYRASRFFRAPYEGRPAAAQDASLS